MSVEKMREEFEAYYAEEFSKVRGYKPMPEEMVSMRDGDHYGLDRSYLNGYWKGWQASRAALVIELPKRDGKNMYGTDVFEKNDMIAAIEAAGVKVKP